MNVRLLLLSAIYALPLAGADFAQRFEQIKASVTPSELYALLFALPKGGDIHHHNGLSIYAGVWYRIATSPATLARNSFYTLTEVHNCPGAVDPQIRFVTIQKATWAALPPCQQSQYEALQSLSAERKAAWISSLMLDKPGEGRDEFFERIVTRLGDLNRDPYVLANAMAENLRLFGAEGVRYIEAQWIPGGAWDATGKPIPPEEANRIVLERLRQPDVRQSGVELRFQDVIIRYRPDAEQQLEAAYEWVSHHRDMWVGINMAGREDNDKGYALRFLPTYRKLRRTYADIPLSIHAGEKDSPGHEVRDTLLLGANRIGHGVNLITDPDTMLLMRNNRYLVEINLVSNRVLEYVPDTSQHPFPEYLRFGIPVCLNTDDRGSWDSNMTDEYFTAVTNFRLTWAEVRQLGRNSLEYSFAEAQLKEKMLRDYEGALAAFERRYGGDDWRAQLSSVRPLISGYANRTWGF
jgi:adenosine deaminase CECR1